MNALLTNENGDDLVVSMTFDDERFNALIYVNGQPYHFERMLKNQLLEDYYVDKDERYDPVTDQEGYCYMLVPVSAS